MEHYYGSIRNLERNGQKAELTVSVDPRAGNLIRDRMVREVEIGIDDGRTISPQQRRKIYATLRDIGEYTGYTIQAIKEIMKVEHMLRMRCAESFSLSNCSVTTAREFINTLMEYALREGIILAEPGLDRTDDINVYLIQCIRYRKCCICGRPADIHHVDAVGMGNDRRHYDDSRSRIMALCRQHHTLYHQRGAERFCSSYKVYGIEKYRTENYRQQEGTG